MLDKIKINKKGLFYCGEGEENDNCEGDENVEGDGNDNGEGVDDLGVDFPNLPLTTPPTFPPSFLELWIVSILALRY